MNRLAPISDLKTDEVEQRRPSYNPRLIYDQDQEIRHALELIQGNYFNMMEPGIFNPILQSLLDFGDHYMLLADLRDYIETQDRVDAAYRDSAGWTRKAILNVACAGKFSFDRTIEEYRSQTWHVEPFQVLEAFETETLRAPALGMPKPI